MNLFDLLFPKKCLECNKEGKYICESCLAKVPTGDWIGNTYSVFKYQGVIRKAIIALKYKFATDIVDELSKIIVDRIKMYDLRFKNATLVPIPLHRYRKNFRGFNQAEIIGKIIAQKMHWQFEPNLLVKTVSTSPQVGLKGLSRRSNLSGVFSVVFHKSLIINHKSILLFDDVYTTGSTIKEAKKVLEKAGFKNILALTVAR